MKFPVLWLAYVSLSVWVGTEKGIRLARDLVSRSRITLHFGAKAEKPKPKPELIPKIFSLDPMPSTLYNYGFNDMRLLCAV